MGIVFSEEQQYKPQYQYEDYTKRRPGRNIYKINKKKVFWRGEEVYGANGNNFIDLGSGYGKDFKYVFYRGYKIKSISRDFSLLDGKYAKDLVRVYYRGIQVVGADVNSFKVTKAKGVYDKYNKYLNGNKL
jgi:hypothetical protein